MKKNVRVVFVLFFVIISAISANVAYALIVSDASVTLACDHYCINAGTTLVTNRDNTGQNQESNGYIITDGFGNNIAGNGGNTAIPNSFTWSIDECHAYDSAPQANPITFIFLSPAGNGLPKQIAYKTTGTCQGLPDAATSVSVPTMTEWGMIIFMMLAGLCSVYYLRRRRRA